ncbi:hypothetical protein GF326_10960 [Candidatus Bathyarchaeota archaeon]|nr:hypothetical protein [Candidatus Bathyarchaeota archaeon]
MDFKELFKEINEVLKEYGISKGIGFVPDELEIHLTRGDRLYKLEYVERFTYLPPEIRDAAIDNAVNLLVNMGVQESGIKVLDDGVRVIMKGHHRVLLFPILELLIQNPEIEHELTDQLDEIHNTVESLINSLAFHWSYNEETQEDVKNSINDLIMIMEENPGIQRKVEEIMKKHIRGDKEINI